MPLQTLQEFMQKEKAAKVIRIPNPGKSCLNPNTTTGCCVTTDLLPQLQEISANRAEKLAAAEEAKVRSQEKAVHQRALHHANTEQLLDVARCPDDPSGWEKLRVELLKSACVVLKVRGLPNNAKKDDRVLALRPLVAEALAHGMPNEEVEDGAQDNAVEEEE